MIVYGLWRLIFIVKYFAMKFVDLTLNFNWVFIFIWFRLVFYSLLWCVFCYCFFFFCILKCNWILNTFCGVHSFFSSTILLVLFTSGKHKILVRTVYDKSLLTTTLIKIKFEVSCKKYQSSVEFCRSLYNKDGKVTRRVKEKYLLRWVFAFFYWNVVCV